MVERTVARPEIRSPLVPRARARFISALPASWIIDQYRRQLDIDVTDSFRGISQVDVYECEETGFRFYHPESIAGSESFYHQLAQFPWFYQEDKWEHGLALELVGPGQRVLDVGCGTGHFLRAARDSRGALVTGIELNQKAAATARERHLEVVGELIEAHASQRPGFYDLVCTFQVLEHVPNPSDFLTACLRALKPGGLFVVGVPNNEAFLKFDPEAILNGPPHHLGLWTRRSLTALTQILPLELVRFELEPLNVVGWYQAVMERRYLPKRWMRSLFHRLGGATLFKRYLLENAATIAGHTIMVVYRKRAPD